MNVPRPFANGGDETYDAYDEFVPAHLPDPGPFLAGHDVLEGRDHAAVHRLARERFEDRGVYDMTFGYNLARLNLDARHPDAGFRYAVEQGSTSPDSQARQNAVERGSTSPRSSSTREDAVEQGSTGPDSHASEDETRGDDERILRAEFTPTTEFCPQSDTLSLGAFRAWNGDPGRHEFDLVRVRVAPMHHQAVAINGKLLQAESQFTETGDLALPEIDGPVADGAPF